MLKPGLCEQVINHELGQELDAATDKLKETAPIDDAEASRVLAKHVAEIIEKGLNNVRDNGDDLHSQVSLAKKIVSLIRRETEEAALDGLTVDSRAEQLLALLSKENLAYALDERRTVARPETSIAQSSLFTGAIHEPGMFIELKKEILSCDRIDMLASFVKWSGLRLIFGFRGGVAGRGVDGNIAQRSDDISAFFVAACDQHFHLPAHYQGIVDHRLTFSFMLC